MERIGGILNTLAKLIGNRGKLGHRVGSRAAGKATGKAMRKLFK